MKCGIVKDLMPSYIDGLTCDDSNREIEKHLEACDKCREHYKEMSKQEFELPVPEEEKRTDLQVLKSFKRYRRRLISGLCIGIGVAIAVVCVVGFYRAPMPYEETKVDVFLSGPSISQILTQGSGVDQVQFQEWRSGLEVIVPEGGMTYELVEKKVMYIEVDGRSEAVVFINCTSSPFWSVIFQQQVEAGYENGLGFSTYKLGIGEYSLDKDGIPISEITKVYYLDKGFRRLDKADNDEILKLINQYGHVVWTKEEGNQSTDYRTLLFED